MTDDARVRRTRLLILAGLVVLAAVVVVIAVTRGGNTTQTTRTSAKATAGMFSGIPQKGLTLGKASAPATVEEYLDPQCPFCAQFSQQALPMVVRNYVRTGKIRLDMKPLTFLGPDSVTAGRAVLAAGRQNLAWPFLEDLYAHQGPENSNYVTDAFLQKVGESVKGLNAGEALNAAKIDPALTGELTAVDARAKQLGVNATPSFVLVRAGQSPKLLNVSADDYAGTFTKSLGDALGR